MLWAVLSVIIKVIFSRISLDEYLWLHEADKISKVFWMRSESVSLVSVKTLAVGRLLLIPLIVSDCTT